MKIQVDFYKPSGKWYAGGQVEIGDAKLGPDLLGIIWDNQKVIRYNTDREQWTIVSDDLHDEFKREDYHHFFKAVLQVGRE